MGIGKISSIRGKILLVFGALFFFFAVASAVGIFYIHRISANIEFVEHVAFQQAIYLIEFETIVKRISNHIVTSVDTGTKQEFVKAGKLKQDLDKKLAEAKVLFAGEKEIFDAFLPLEKKIEEYFQIGEKLLFLTVNQNWTEIAPATTMFNTSQEGIFDLIAEIRSRGVERLNQSINEASRLTKSTVSAIGVVVFTALFFCTALAYFLGYQIVHPIQGLIGIMKKAEGGDFSVRADISSRDETGALSKGFNEMLGHIQRRDRELAMHRDNLEGLVTQRTSDLENANTRLQRELGERERAEQAVMESEEHLRQILDSVHSGIMIIDTETHTIVDVNAFAVKLIGVSREQIVHRVCHHFVCAAEVGKCPITDLGKTVDNAERELLRFDGGRVPIIKSVVPITYKGRQLLIESFISIQELKDAERELKRYAERLAKSNSNLQDFAYVASHDLQEPLRKVLAFGERLESKYGDRIGENGRDYLARMRSASGRMQVLIDDLLSFSRVTTKGQPFQLVDLGDVAREVVSDLEVRIEQTGGRVEIGALPTIDADPLQMRQLLQNLVGNALKFRREDEPPVVRIHSLLGEDGGGKPGVEAPVNGMCELFVDDNGIGFDEQYRHRIFGVFQRLHGRGQYEGTGVGLAICAKIAERHGGSIRAKSLRGKGSTFIVSLPVRQEKNEETG